MYVVFSLLNLHGSTINKLTIYQMNSNYETAILGGGCFWCSEAVFLQVKGVISVSSGYSGGFIKNPSYREVCNGTTGHAEVVKITFDPSVIKYSEILDIFFHTHDPTTLNKQGGDVGTQYRSVIFYNNVQQKSEAEKIIKDLEESSIFSRPIVTAVEKLTNFYMAEDYHQNYFAENPNEAYCNLVVRPKVDKFKKNYSEKLKN